MTGTQEPRMPAAPNEPPPEGSSGPQSAQKPANAARDVQAATDAPEGRTATPVAHATPCGPNVCGVVSAGPELPADTAPRCTCGHTKRDHSGPRQAADLPLKYKYWCHSCEFGCVYCPADDTPEQPIPTTLPAKDAPAPEPGLREQYAEAIRDAACTGDCDATEEACAQERIQPVVWHSGGLAEVSGSPEMFADAVLAVLAVRDTELQQLREQVAQVREWLPVLRRAVDSLPAVCRYHGDQLDPDRFARMTRSEACCDTGAPARRRREAVKALEALDPKEQP